MNWVKRSDVGLYRVLGLRRADIALIQLVETSTAILVGSVLGALVATAVIWSGSSQTLAFGWVAAGLATLGQLVACWLLSVVLWGSNPIDQIKDR